MKKRYRNVLYFVFPLMLFAIWIDLPSDPAVIGSQAITTHLGLDLVGGVQVLLEADLPAETEVDQESMGIALQTIEGRVNGMLGVGEVVLQQVGDRRILVELPGETDPERAISVIGETGQLEFVDFGVLSTQEYQSLIGSIIVTDYPEILPDTENQKIWHTVITGQSIDEIGVQQNPAGAISVGFVLDTAGTKIFRDYTSNNIGSYLAIVLDKQVISAPQISSAITAGRGDISGNFTQEKADDLAVKLRYGSLPIPFEVVQSKTIGPSLGQDSLAKSLKAGLIGLSLVMLFMLIYYRLPGLIADAALLLYVIFAIALFKIIPVTLTLPGIAGFILSIGVAVDANILIFERMREELQNGKSLHNAINQGWSRAWPSIRDSNFSTLITCFTLFWFGSFFGSSIVKGFAVTLALGVGISLFTAIVITRSFLHLTLDNIRLADHRPWFGVKKGV